jgi:hypothetical protein
VPVKKGENICFSGEAKLSLVLKNKGYFSSRTSHKGSLVIDIADYSNTTLTASKTSELIPYRVHQ